MPRAKVVRLSEDIAPASVTIEPVPNAEVIEQGGNTYQEVAACAVCNRKVYGFVSGNPNVNAIGDALVVYAATGRREAPTCYCQAHDPNIQHRLSGGKPGDVASGDAYQAFRARL